MSRSQVLFFAAGGGMPPASSEELHLYDDGQIAGIVGNAWPEGTPQDEAGLYQMVLPPADLAEIKSMLQECNPDDLQERYGPIQMDSGRKVLRVYSGNARKTVKWSPYSELPVPLQKLQERLRALINEIRRYPVQVVRAEVDIVPGRPSAGQDLKIAYSLSNPGTKPVKMFLSRGDGSTRGTSFRYYAVFAGEAASDFVPLTTYYANAHPIAASELFGSRAAGGEIVLLPEQETRASAQISLPAAHPGSYQVYGFVEFQIEISLQDQAFQIDCFTLTQPVSLELEN